MDGEKVFTKDSKVEEKDLVLIDTQNIQEKCGACGEQLIIKVYWTKDGDQQKIECTKCGLSIWKSLKQ